MKKKLMSLFLTTMILLTISSQVFASSNEIEVYIDGTKLIFENQPPIIDNGRTLVPMRAMFEALGAYVEWNDDTKTATGSTLAVFVSIRIGENTMNRNFVDVPLEVPAQIINGATMIPLRAVSECFDMQVNWDGINQTITLTDLGTIGNLYWNDEYTYWGEINGDYGHGYGIIYNKNSNLIVRMGLFAYSDIMQGAHFYENKNFYIGTFKNGLSDGIGEFYYANGNKYIGDFVNGEFSGQGTMYDSNWEIIYSGEWKNGNPYDSTIPEPPIYTEEDLRRELFDLDSWMNIQKADLYELTRVDPLQSDLAEKVYKKYGVDKNGDALIDDNDDLATRNEKRQNAPFSYQYAKAEIYERYSSMIEELTKNLFTEYNKRVRDIEKRYGITLQ